MKICVIGAGRWGINHIRTLNEIGALECIVDSNKKQLNKFEKIYPDIKLFDNLKMALELDIDGFVISTPANTHIQIAKKIINIGKPILIEKPLALSLKEAQDLNHYVEKSNSKILVGHLLLFHPAIQKMKSMVNNGIIGKIQYIYSNRLNLGIVRENEDVFWSFAPHDISLFQYFTDSFPKKIKSIGGSFLKKNRNDTTITHFTYPNNIQGHIYVSWLHPFKEHRLVIIGSKGTLAFKDSSKGSPLIHYIKDDTFKSNSVLKNKSVKKIDYKYSLPLLNELNYFIEVINGLPITKCSFKEGLDVIKVLEMSIESQE
jgi:UDP-2-acetamido-3-amino-2,3-dideoxy-glucuronate N-acetyltransferase